MAKSSVIYEFLGLKFDRTLDKYNVRVVVKGYPQTKGIDYTETFGPNVKPTTIRIVITLSLTYGWLIRQLDDINSFLNGDLDEEVYMV